MKKVLIPRHIYLPIHLTILSSYRQQHRRYLMISVYLSVEYNAPNLGKSGEPVKKQIFCSMLLHENSHSCRILPFIVW